MLRKFVVENFKNFQKKIELDFSNYREYQFNKNNIRDNLINHSIVYGKNGSGKSNLGLAIFDIVFHLTDKDENNINRYNNYINLNSNKKVASFKYEFQFDDNILLYEYEKKDINTLVKEKVTVNEKVILDCNHDNYSKTFVDINGAEKLNWSDDDINISAVKYIVKNTNLSSDNLLNRLILFVENMLWFRSVEKNAYIGFKKGRENLDDIIIDNNKLQEFQKFLAENGLNYNLKPIKLVDKKRIMVKFNNGDALFNDVISTGTKDLWLLYCWYIYIEKLEFLFIDEFDSNYHFELSEKVINMLNKTSDCQIMVTSHNTYLMSNKITRPDCVFLLNDNKIKNLPDCTEKELREAHNIEKLYRNGKFVD